MYIQKGKKSYFMNLISSESINIILQFIRTTSAMHTKRHWWDETTRSNVMKLSGIDGNASHLNVSYIYILKFHGFLATEYCILLHE